MDLREFLSMISIYLVNAAPAKFLVDVKSFFFPSGAGCMGKKHAVPALDLVKLGDFFFPQTTYAKLQEI